MRRRLGIPEKDFLIFVGKAPASNYPRFLFTDNHPGILFLVPSGILCPYALVIPMEETESQNWIGMCDCILAKCGYSTVSEAVRATIPLLVWKREGFIEDDAIATRIENLGIGRRVSGVDEGIRYCLDNRSGIEAFRQNFDKIDPIYKDDGIYTILTVIQRIIQ